MMMMMKTNLYNSLNFGTRRTTLVSKERSKPVDFKNIKFERSQIFKLRLQFVLAGHISTKC